jgi:regulatory protein
MESIEPAILHYCKYQERCHSEVLNKLYELGFTTDTVEHQLSLLIQAGALNEERFARAYARGRFRMKQWGREKIKQHLRLKRISEYCIKKGLSEIDPEEYDNTFNKISFKKWEELRGERSIATKKGKIYRYLIQKGFERDLVMDVIQICIKNSEKCK